MSFNRTRGQKPSDKILQKKFPEWILLENLIDDLSHLGNVTDLGLSSGVSQGQQMEFPIMAFSFGNPDPKAPVLGLIGGVHGLERIGAQVVLALLKSFSELILWDKMLAHALTQIRIFFVPMVNPIGILNQTRSNPNGVDLMRNAPHHGEDKPTFLVGGQTISPRMWWFRGSSVGKMETESQALLDYCRMQFFQSRAALTMDFHSGFGILDRIWFPYAKTTKPFPHLAEAYAFKKTFDRTYPNHIYRIEPQAKNYTTHGDLWDYTYDQYYLQNTNGQGMYLPLALEMGSWLWVKKNPLQLFSSLGPFNPLKPHRQRRILRRHLTLFDFLVRAMVTPDSWAHLNPEQKNVFFSRAIEEWYDGAK